MKGTAEEHIKVALEILQNELDLTEEEVDLVLNDFKHSPTRLRAGVEVYVYITSRKRKNGENVDVEELRKFIAMGDEHDD